MRARPTPTTPIARTLLLVLASLCGGLVPARAGDPELARFLLKHGKEALAKGKPDDALSKFEKAREEDPSLLEATFWIASALEARKETTRAVAEYRAFLEAAERALEQRELVKDEVALLRKARARLAALDAGTLEIERANGAFAGQVVGFAKGRLARDADLAERALRLLLAIQPDSPDAEKLLAELTGTGAAGPSVLSGFSDTWDLISSHGFGKNDGWRYGEDGVLSVQEGGGSAVWTPDGYDSGDRFAMEAEIELQGPVEPGRTWVVGLGFSRAGGDAYSLLYAQGNLELRTLGSKGQTLLALGKAGAWPSGARHTIAVRVEGRSMQGFFDGERLIDQRVNDRTGYAGDIGVVTENCTLRFHRLVFARPGKD